MKMTKSELRQMIRECLKEELSRKNLTESDATSKRIQEIRSQIKALEQELASLTQDTEVVSSFGVAEKPEAEYDAVMRQIKADLLKEITPTPVVDFGEEFYGDFKDIHVSWDQWDETNRFDADFRNAYDATVDWVYEHANRYPGFKLNFLEPGEFNDYFVTINVYGK
jgi:hypothetical protein